VLVLEVLGFCVETGPEYSRTVSFYQRGGEITRILEHETSELVCQIFLGELLTSLGVGWTALLEGLQIALGVVGGAVFAAGKEDADPFEGHHAHCGVMALALSPLGLVKGFGPAAVTDGTGCEFVKGLSKELGTGVTEKDAGLFLALFALLSFLAAFLTTGAPHWGDAI
jgi:hypothetical protein